MKFLKHTNLILVAMIEQCYVHTFSICLSLLYCILFIASNQPFVLINYLAALMIDRQFNFCFSIQIRIKWYQQKQKQQLPKLTMQSRYKCQQNLVSIGYYNPVSIEPVNLKQSLLLDIACSTLEQQKRRHNKHHKTF